MKFVYLFIFIIELMFCHSHTNINTAIQSEKYKSIWWNQFEVFQRMKSHYDLLKQEEKKEENLKEIEQENRNKIYRDKLVSQIKSSVLNDFWTNRY